MKIYFYRHASFKPTDVQIYDCNGVVEFFDKNHINPDEYVICDKHGNEHNYDYDLKDDIYIIFPKIAKGSSGKGWLGVVLGIVTIFTAGATAGLLGLTLNGARMLGVGMLLSGAGTLIMGQQKLPSMDINTDSATKQNYQWNVGNLSTNRGVKGVTFGSDVVPEGELLAYRTYGTSSITGGTSNTRYYYGNKEISREQYKANKAADRNSVFNYLSRAETTHTDAYANDDGTSWLEMLIGCGEGELDSITDIKVNDTPIENIININDESTGKCITRLGSNNQTSIPSTDLDRQVGIMSVGQTMPQKLSGSDTPLVITTSHACDSALIALQTNVLYNMDTQSGAKNRCYLKPKIGYRLSGSTGAYTYVNTGIGEIDNDLPLKAESAFYFNVAIKFPSNGIYEISLQNCSAEKCVQKGILGSLPTVLPDRLQCGISIDNIALYDNIEQTFPGTALIYLRLPASQALSGSMPKVTWKQSRNNTYVWNGSSYVAKPLDNLAWAIYDILAQVKKDGSNYHNEGEDVHNIDYDKFADFADFCDDLDIKGNWFLNKLDTAWSTAMSVATSARAFIGTRNGKIAPFWDCETEMTQIFTVGNYESLSGAVNAKKDRARAIEATFNDEDDNYISKTIRVEVDDFAADADAVGVTYVGLTNVDAVYKAAHYQLRKNKYLCQTVKFTANLDALVCELNDVIGVQCDITKYGVGGRIFAVNGNSISLDAPVTLNGGNYALLVAHDNGTVERMQVVEHTGTLTTVTISGYTRAPKANEVYSFGVVNDEVKKYRVTSIVKTSDLKCEIEAVEYQPQVYVEGVAPDISYTNPNANISNIAVTYNPEGVDIAWHKDVNTAYVDVYVDGVYYGRFAEGATIPNVNSTQEIECVPVNAYGEEGTSVVRAISNSIPAPSQPPVPIVQALPTGAVVQFQIPQNQYITWIIIKEGDDELGRSIVAGDEVTLNLNLEGGTHHLTAYFLNSYGKTSIGRDFDATPFGIDSNMLSNGFLMKPQGSILRLSAKGCTTASIRQTTDASGNPVYGVKDVSGYNHHGQAFGGVSVLDGGEGFGFDNSQSTYLELPNSYDFSNGFSIVFRFKPTTANIYRAIVEARGISNSSRNFLIATGNSMTTINLSMYPNGTPQSTSSETRIELNKELHYVATYSSADKKLSIFVDGVLKKETTFSETPLFESVNTILVGKYRTTTGGTLGGELRDFRIYPRALSATEVKSMYMLPDEAIFGQLNADLIGANVINASNLVKTQALITESAQIDSGIFNTLVANSANFQNVSVKANNALSIIDGRRTTNDTPSWYMTNYPRSTIREFKNASSIGVTGTTMYVTLETYTPWNDSSGGYPTQIAYANGTFGNTGVQKAFKRTGTGATTWSAWVSVDNIVDSWATSGTTTINGGKITTGSITANQIQAGAITAEKLNVSPIIPPKCYARLNVTGLTDTSAAVGTVVPNMSNVGNLQFKVAGAAMNLNSWTSSLTGQHFSCGAGSGTQHLVCQTSVTIGTALSVLMGVDNSNWNQVVFFDMMINDSSSNNRLYFGAETNRHPRLGIYNSSGSATDYNFSNITIPTNTSARIGFVINGTSATVYCNGQKETKTITARSSSTITRISFGNLVSPAASRGCGHMCFPSLWLQALSDDQVTMLLEKYLLFNTESGQITADRIQAGCIETRHLTANAIVGKTFATAANVGSGTSGVRFNSSGIQGFNGSTKKFDLSTTGKLTCSDVDLSGKITATSGSFTGTVNANAGNIGNWSINNDGLYHRVGSSSNYAYLNPTHLVVYGSDNTCFTSIEGKGGTDSYSVSAVRIGANQAANYWGLLVVGKTYCSSGTWSGSDINIKSQIKSESVLNRLKQIEVASWKYDQDKIDSIEAEKKGKEYKCKNIGTKDQPKHFGAMAQEFNAMFGTSNGSSDSLCYTDTIGVCMRAIQELSEQLDNAVREIRRLKRILKSQNIITDEIVSADKDSEAIRRLTIAKARQAKREEQQDENIITLDNNTNDDGLR